MPDSKQYNRLLLYAAAEQIKIDDSSRLIEPLASYGFIGERFQVEGQTMDFLAGARFLDLVSFLGCSPSISFTPEEDTGQGFCFIRLHALNRVARLYSGSNTTAPTCRRCHQKHDDWREILSKEADTGLCDDCSRNELGNLLGWRKRAAMTRLAIEVMNIYPHEAVPSPALIEQLSQVSGAQWSHAFLQADSHK